MSFLENWEMTCEEAISVLEAIKTYSDAGACAVDLAIKALKICKEKGLLD